MMTQFPHAALTTKPRAGHPILFTNAREGGMVDPAAQHASLPVRQGVKWIATRWIRERAFDQWVGPEHA